MECVVAGLDDLEQRCGEALGQIFKMITVDNGSEFSDAEGMAWSALTSEAARAQSFFCHAYCSWEQGSNENQNTMDWRRYPKGFDFADTTEEEIKALERWTNNYPRGIFNYRSAAKMFQQEFGDRPAARSKNKIKKSCIYLLTTQRRRGMAGILKPCEAQKKVVVF